VNDWNELPASMDSEVNLLAGGGWEYLRTDRVPVRKRRFLFLYSTTYRDVMVFRRAMAGPRLVEMEQKTAPEVSVRPRRVVAKRRPGVRPNLSAVATEPARAVRMAN
jgi:hypothetical protein